MNPHEFLQKYPVCPKCAAEFRQHLMVFSDDMIEPCSIRTYSLREYDLKISMEVPGHPNMLDFSINYTDGAVKLYNNTKWDDFHSNEPFSVSLDFACENCGIFEHRGVYVSFFGRTLANVFDFGCDLIYFQYVIDDVLYAVSTDYENGKTTLEIHKLNIGFHHKLELPVIELSVFDFSDKSKMKEKLDTIMLLA